MANSDWAREAIIDPWEYFEPTLGDFPEAGWQFSGNGADWHGMSDYSPVCRRDLDLLWRKHRTSKEN